MRPVNTYQITIPTGGTYRGPWQGSSFKILAATGLVEVRGDWGRIDQCAVGQGISGTDFGYLVLTNLHTSPNTIKVICGDAGFIDNITGTVAVTANTAPTSGAFVQVLKSVTNAGALLLAANPARKYLMIQNNDASGVLSLGFGAQNTLAGGLKIGPGGYFEPGVVPTNAIYAIGDIANNAAVMTVEG